MSLGYAEKLSYRDASFLGKLGAAEKFDALEDAEAKVKELAELIQKSKHMLVYTGAGISTSCGIPDFRGPNGIWTLQSTGKPIPQATYSFAQARPSYTHMALKALLDAGKVHYIVSQNVDCLHLRSGIPRCQLAELHGNCFREICPKCGAEYVRDFELETVGLKSTGRRCTVPGCEGRLKDSVLDWEDALPADELAAADRHSKEADLALCLGTSLQIIPARDMPVKCIRGGGKVVIVNLQATPRDKKAALVIHAKADEVMQGVMRTLNLDVRPYVRVDRLVVAHTLKHSPMGSNRRWVLSLRSSHGPKAPLRFVKHAKVTFLSGEHCVKPLAGPKFELKGSDKSDAPFEDLSVDVEFVEGMAARHVTLDYRLHLNPDLEIAERESTSEDLRTMVEEASETGRVGAVLVTSARQERGASFVTLWQTEYAIVTDVVDYRLSSSAASGSVGLSARIGIDREGEGGAAARIDGDLTVELELGRNRDAICESAEPKIGEGRAGTAGASKRLGAGTKRKHDG
eukprot:TRINITY_DN604_c0_g1_i2.p1 TRINITY_DN604_c0_g1~~TRINITY_DN604_c0_g1_i2.p1  ORF type:complete len:516 (-),score=81.36 TRINITY_DN604_c0_g1_i2:112-1659(-)